MYEQKTSGRTKEVKSAGFVKVGELSEVSVGKMKMFKVGEKEYLIANVKA